MKILTVALNNRSDIPACVFETPPCNTSNPIIRVSDLAARLLSPHGFQRTEVRFIAASQENDIYSTSSGSLFNLVKDGKANLTAAYMSLTAERAAMFSYTRFIYRDRFMFVYKKLERVIPSFDPFAIVDLNTLLFIGVFVILWKASNVIFGQSKLFQKFSNRSGIVLGLALQLFLGYISSNVVLLFNQQSKSYKPFQSRSDVAEAFCKGEYILLTYSRLAIDTYFNSSKGKGGPFDLMQQCAKLHGKPEIIADFSTGIDRVLNSKGRKPYMVIAKTRLLPQMRTMSCDLDYFIDDANPDLKVMFYAKGANMTHLDVLQFNLLSYEKQKYENIYYRPQDCDSDTFPQGPRPISISQVQTVPWLMLGMSLLATVVLTAERFVLLILSARSHDTEDKSTNVGSSLQEEKTWIDIMSSIYAVHPAMSLSAKAIVQQRLNELRRLITEDRTSATLAVGI